MLSTSFRKKCERTSPCCERRRRKMTLASIHFSNERELPRNNLPLKYCNSFLTVIIIHDFYEKLISLPLTNNTQAMIVDVYRYDQDIKNKDRISSARIGGHNMTPATFSLWRRDTFAADKQLPQRHFSKITFLSFFAFRFHTIYESKSYLCDLYSFCSHASIPINKPNGIGNFSVFLYLCSPLSVEQHYGETTPNNNSFLRV